MKKQYFAPAVISHKIQVESALLSNSNGIEWGNETPDPATPPTPINPDETETDIPVVEDDVINL